MFNPTRVRIVAVLAPIALVACSGGSDSETLPDPPPVDIEPLAVYADTDATDERTLAAAVDQFFRACMLDAGFEIPQFPEPAVTTGSRSNPFQFTVEDAERDGYAFSAEEDVENLQTWFTKLDESVKNAFYEAAFGPEPVGTLPVIDAANPGDVRDVLPPRLGCDGEATRTVMGDTSAYESVRLQLQAAYNGSAQQALTDSRLGDETQAWSDCMQDSGYDYSDPSEARNAAYDHPATDQQRIAMTDAQCRETTGYNEAGTQLMWSFQNDWLAANPGVLEEYRTLRQAALDRAADALSVTAGG